MKTTAIQMIPVRYMRVVKIETDEGITGLGEVIDCHFETVAFAISQLPLVGKDPTRIEEFWQQMYHRTFWRGGPIWTSVISGVEQALWDIKAKALGVPVNHLLGGPLREKIKLYSNLGRVNTPEECVRAALDRVEKGYKAIKFDPFGSAYQTIDGKEMRASMAKVKAVREAIGEDIDLLIEAHGRFNPNTAIRLGRMLEDFHPFFYEEPVPPENVDEMAKVAESVNIPIATGERLYTRWGFRELLEKQIADYIQPDLCHTGGFWEGRKIAAMAEVYHVRVIPHNPNGPISSIVAVHLGACTPNFEMLEYPQRSVEVDAILKEPLSPQDGYLAVPTGPGWGVELNEEAIARGFSQSAG